MQEIKEIRCPICKSKLVYFRIKTRTLVCRSCGNEHKKIEEKQSGS